MIIRYRKSLSLLESPASHAERLELEADQAQVLREVEEDARVALSNPPLAAPAVVGEQESVEPTCTPSTMSRLYKGEISKEARERAAIARREEVVKQIWAQRGVRIAKRGVKRRAAAMV
jgi:hypothetical protein